MTDLSELSDDDRRLAELGYKQELDRSWSGFSNFAISFSIISILAGCFTTFGQAWNNGGPVAISWGWPIISAFILIIGLTMSELVSAYPTSGGIYWWASKMGGPKAGFFTGWLNLIGLVAVTASVAYGCAFFIDLTMSTFSPGYAADYSLTRVFVTFLIVLVAASGLNIFSGHLMAVMNNVSVWWHVAGVAIIVLILAVVPKQHQSFAFVFTERINNSGYADSKYWFLVLPLAASAQAAASYGLVTRITPDLLDSSAPWDYTRFLLVTGPIGSAIGAAPVILSALLVSGLPYPFVVMAGATWWLLDLFAGLAISTLCLGFLSRAPRPFIPFSMVSAAGTVL